MAPAHGVGVGRRPQLVGSWSAAGRQLVGSWAAAGRQLQALGVKKPWTMPGRAG